MPRRTSLVRNIRRPWAPREHSPERTKEKRGFAPPPCAVTLAKCRRYRGTLSCAGRASGGEAQSLWSNTGVVLSLVSEGGKKIRTSFFHWGGVITNTVQDRGARCCGAVSSPLSIISLGDVSGDGASLERITLRSCCPFPVSLVGGRQSAAPSRSVEHALVLRCDPPPPVCVINQCLRRECLWLAPGRSLLLRFFASSVTCEFRRLTHTHPEGDGRVVR